jgi:hypothetical protein
MRRAAFNKQKYSLQLMGIFFSTNFFYATDSQAKIIYEGSQPRAATPTLLPRPKIKIMGCEHAITEV